MVYFKYTRINLSVWRTSSISCDVCSSAECKIDLLAINSLQCYGQWLCRL